MERSGLESGHRQIGLEAVDLPSVAVAAHGDVDGAEALLVGTAVQYVVGEQDHPGARAGNRHLVRQPLGDRGEQTRGLEQERHRGRFAARHDQGVDTVEIAGNADLYRLSVELTHPRAWAAKAPWSVRTPARCSARSASAVRSSTTCTRKRDRVMVFTAVQEGLFDLHDDGTLDLVGGYSPTSDRYHFPLLTTCPYTGADDVER